MFLILNLFLPNVFWDINTYFYVTSRTLINFVVLAIAFIVSIALSIVYAFLVHIHRTHGTLLILNETISRIVALSLSFYSGIIISGLSRANSFPPSNDSNIFPSWFAYVPVVLCLLLALLFVLASIWATNSVKFKVDRHGCVAKIGKDGQPELDSLHQYICDSQDRYIFEDEIRKYSKWNVFVLILTLVLALVICFNKTVNPEDTEAKSVSPSCANTNTNNATPTPTPSQPPLAHGPLPTFPSNKRKKVLEGNANSILSVQVNTNNRGSGDSNTEKPTPPKSSGNMALTNSTH